MKRKYSILACVLVAAMLVSAAGCSSGGGTESSSSSSSSSSSASSSSSSSAESDTTTKDSIVIAMQQDVDSLDPYAVAGYATTIKCNIFDTLVAFDENMEIVPSLATSWEFADDLSYIDFTLREGVTFHNGETFSADDVVYSFRDRYLTSEVGASETYFDFANVEKLSDYEVRIPLLIYTSTALYKLTSNIYAIMNQKAVEDAGDQVGMQPVGTGAYQFVSWTTGDRVVLTAYDDYWGEAPQIKDVTFRIISESTQAGIELETGGVDFVCEPASTDLERVQEGLEGFKIVTASNNQQGTLYFNYNHEWAQDIRVRQAIAYALDVEAITTAVYPVGGRVARTTVNADLSGYYDGYDTTPCYTQDTEKAIELLQESGYYENLTLTFLIDDSTYNATAAQVIKNQLEQVGITVEISTLDGATYFQVVVSGEEYDLTIVGHGSETNEAGGSLAWETNSYYPDWDQSGASGLFDELSDQITAAIAISDDTERNAAYAELQQEIMEQVVKIPLWDTPVQATCVDNLQNTVRISTDCMIAQWYFE